MSSLQSQMEKLIAAVKAGQSVADFSAKEKALVEDVLRGLDTGALRVAEKINQVWTTHAWIKESILFYFRLHQVAPMSAGDLNFLDKIPVKHFKADSKVRVVPPAVARFGSFIEEDAILMPSYVNIGARVGKGTMIDTWATVGSCAQVGSHVHVSGGVGIGGVLEPVQAQPVIIEDHAFIGSRCIIVEGVRIGEGAVLGAGVTLTASTKIIDVTGSSEKVLQGEVPANAVVIPGQRDKKFPAGTYGVPCALIIGSRKESTDRKTSLNSALREFDVSV